MGENKMNPQNKPYYIKFDTPAELADAALEALRQAKDGGKIRKGVNETTKTIERGEAKLVVIAEDVDPAEIVAHLPVICGERKVPYLFVKSKLDLGKAIGLDVPSAAASIVDVGPAKAVIDQITSSLSKIIGV